MTRKLGFVEGRNKKKKLAIKDDQSVWLYRFY